MLTMLLLFDIIVFVNGNSVEGKVTKVTDEVIVVQVKGGELVIPRERVKKIIEKPYKIEEEPPPKEETKEQKQPPSPFKKKKPQKEEKKPEGSKERKEKPLTQDELRYLRRLVDLIGNRRVALRRRARLALSQFGPRATPVLISALSDGNFWRRMNAASLLGEFGRPEAAKPLLPLLADPVLAVRVAAHSALTRITKTYVTYNPNYPNPTAISLWHKAVQNFLKALKEKEKREREKPSDTAEHKKQRQEKPPWERPPPQQQEEPEPKQEKKDVVIEP